MTDEPLEIHRTEPESKPDSKASAGFDNENGHDTRRSRMFGERRNRAPKSDTPKVLVSIPNRKGQFVDTLTKLYAGVGTMWAMVDPICAQAWIVNAEACAKAVDQWAYENESVRRAVWMITQTSTMGTVIIVHMPILMTILMHHSPRAQEMFGQMGANMMEEFLKQTTPDTPNE